MWEKFDLALEQRGLKQWELEQMLQLPKNRISKWKGGIPIPAREALRIARALGLDLDYLVDEERQKPVEGYSAEEKALIGVFRGSNLSLEDAAKRLGPDSGTTDGEGERPRGRKASRKQIQG